MHFAFTTLGYHPDQTGGAFRYVTEMAEGLARRGHAVEVIYPGVGVERPARAPEHRNGVVLHRIEARGKTFWQRWAQRNEAARDRLGEIRGRSPDALIVSCHAYFARAVIAARGPIISLFTGPWAEEFLVSNSLKAGRLAREKLIAPILRKMENGALRRSQAILTISRYYEECLPQWHPEARRPLRVIEAGVDLEEFQPASNRTELRKQLGLDQEDFVFLTVRRLEPRMGLKGLIEAFKLTSHEFPRAQLWIAGDGSQRAALEAEIRGADRVRMLGFVPEAELPRRYAVADCTVMPSIDLEGFGLSTVESLACGTPVIGARTGATPEILKPLSADLLYDPPSGLEDKLRAILRNPSAFPSREKCRAYAVERYAWDAPVRAFEHVCLQLARGGPL